MSYYASLAMCEMRLLRNILKQCVSLEIFTSVKRKKAEKAINKFFNQRSIFCSTAQFMVCLSFFCPIIVQIVMLPPAASRRPKLGFFGPWRNPDDLMILLRFSA